MVHLHTHTMYSLRDSIIRIDELIDKLKDLNQNSIAITEHGRNLGTVAIYKQMKEANIKYIHGCEVYICDDVSIKNKDNRYYHLILLCKNEVGRLNLNTLMSISEHPDNFYYKPRIDFNILKQYSEGLICLSACMAGEISRFLEVEELEEAKKRALKYKEIFQDDYYLEIQAHMDSSQIVQNKKIVKLAKELDIELVVTCDAHYVNKEDKNYQNKYAFNGSYKEDGEIYVDCFIQSEEEVYERIKYLDSNIVTKAIKNTHIISDKCNVEIPLSAPIMPHLDVPKEFKDSTEWLISVCKDGFIKKLNINYDNKKLYDSSKMNNRYVYDDFGELEKIEQYQLTEDEIVEYVSRFDYEIDSLHRMGFVDYILLVYSYANVAKRRGIARGSGGGSLVCYVSNITDIDPIEHKLYFERFIDVGALDLLESGEITQKELKIPDIDLDFSSDSCTEVLDFLVSKYGENNVASIGRFGTNKTKGTIRDMCKVFNMSLEQEDEIAKSFGEYELEEIDMMISGDIPTIESAKEAISNTKKYKELFEYVRKLIGLPKSFGLHPCGRIISTKELDFFTPSCYDSTGVRFLQGDMYDVEDLGLVKIDVLGLRTIDQEYDTLEMTNEDIDFISSKQDFSDKKVLDIFRNGDTIGIFQMSSFGMKSTLKKMDVQGIEDLSIANALYRPGAMAYIDNFCRRRKGEESFEYLHPDLEEILKNTYGIMVFQEQLIEIGRLAKIRNPDKLRKATGKKDIKLLNQVKPELEHNLKNRGWTQEQFDQLWTDMIEFSKYSFNKSHSSAYGIIAYVTAKQKAYYPKEFYAGLLNSYIGASSFVKDHVDEIVEDMNRHGINFNKLDFRKDHRRCYVDGKGINYALCLIKDCNKFMAEQLYLLKDNKYDTFVDLLLDIQSKKILNKTQLNILIKLDFFSEFGNIRELSRISEFVTLFKFGESKTIKKDKIESDEMLTLVKKYATDKNDKGKELKSYTFFDLVGMLREYEQIIKDLKLEDLSFKLKIEAQKEYLGYISLVSGNPEDRPKLYVKEVYPLKRKSDGKNFGISVTCQSVGSGIQNRFTVFNKAIKKCGEVKEGNIIYCIKYSRNGEYFTIEEFTQVV